MPNYLKPITKATPEQMRAILERIVARKSGTRLVPDTGGMNPVAAREMLQHEPPVERTYGQLLDKGNPDKPITRTLPIDEAMNTYMNNPDRYGTLPVGPSAKHVYATDPGGLYDSSRLGEGIAMERMKFQNPVPSSVRSNQASITRELLGQNVPAPPTMEPQGVVKSAVKKLPESEIGNVLGMAARLEDLWRSMGGGRSGVANMWKQYLLGSSEKNKIKNAKDYFIASAIRNHNDPAMMAKRYPREKRLLDNMKSVYRENMGIDLDTGEPFTKLPTAPGVGE